MKQLLSILFAFMLPVFANAQNNDNFMYSSGRIYVVIAVLVTIFVGIVFYLIRIEKNIKKLKNNEK